MTARRRTIGLSKVWLACTLLVAILVPPALAADRLGKYGADQNAVSVSGLSSGGYMAQQYHVAHSKQIMGVGIFAAGPWDCADSLPGAWSYYTATTICSNTNPALPFAGPPNLQYSITATRAAARNNQIDPVDSLAKARVFLFAGTKDTVEPKSVGDVLNQYYQAFVPASQIRYVDNVPAQHAMVTDHEGNACDHLGTPFINACGFDGVGEMLKFIYGPLNPPADPSTGQLLEVRQTEFLPSDPIGMGPVGYLFIPADCRLTPGCRLHVAFHGCEQSKDAVGDAFFAHAGYNRWAATNRIIVLYPQAQASTFAPLNPKGCWDWFAYNDSRFDTRGGAQIVAIRKMIGRVLGQPS